MIQLDVLSIQVEVFEPSFFNSPYLNFYRLIYIGSTVDIVTLPMICATIRI